MSKQVWAREFACTLSSTASTFSLGGGAAASTIADAANNVVCPAAGVISALTVAIDTAPAAGTTKIFTLRVNNVDTAMVITIDENHTSATYAGTGITVAAGDLLCVSYTKTGTPGSSTIASISWVWTGQSGVSIYVGGNTTINTTTPRWYGPFSPGESTTTTAANLAQNVVAAPGTITGYYVTVPAVAGTTGSYTFTLFKNGTAQNGTSGTPDTRLTYTCSAARVTSNVSFSLAVVAGDLVYLQIDSNSTPSSKTYSFGLAFTATNAGESNFCWSLPTFPGSVGVNSFNGPHCSVGAISWNTVGARQSIVADKFKLYNMQMWATAAPGGATSRTFSNVQNGSAGSLAVTLTTGATGSDLTHQINYAALDLICFNESAISGSPAAATGSVGFVQFIQGGNPPGKSQGGSKKSGGGDTNNSVPGGTQVQTVGNAGVSSVSL